MSIQFIKVQHNKLVFMKDQMKKAFSGIDRDSKLTIITVNGAARTGKSTVLNSLVAASQKEGPVTSSDINTHFKTGPGIDPITFGLWIWVKPEPIADNTYLVLIDTQGIFDHTMDQKLVTSLFSLSTLISSFQIFNLDKRIQEDDLQHLELFSKYANVIADSGYRPFQTLCFLVHDWQNFTNMSSSDQCLQESNDYIKKVIDGETTDEGHETRKRIKTCFQRFTCHCLPHPGLSFSETGVGDVRTVFLDGLSQFAHRAIRQAPAKTVFDQELHLGGFELYIEQCVKGLEEHHGLPEPKTILGATVDALWYDNKQRLVQQYHDHMRETFSTTTDQEQWKKAHRLQIIKIDAELDKRLVLCSKKQRSKLQMEIVTLLDIEYTKLMEETVRIRRWNIFVHLALLGVIMLVFSNMTNILCSLEICYRLSSMSYGGFWLIIMVLLIRLAWIVGLLDFLNGKTKV